MPVIIFGDVIVKMANILQTTFSNAFPRMKIFEFQLIFH